MLRTLLICGMLAGACGGVLSTGLAQLTAEPAIERSIAFEDARAQAAHETPAPELVSRDLQRSAGLLTAAVVYGLAFGGIFALVFAFVYGRVGRAGPARTALWLAAATFAVVFLVPFVKYPANPPSVGDPGTIARRTELFLTMMASSVLVAVAAVRVRATLVARGTSSSTSTLLALGAYLAIVVGVGLALPGVHEVPRSFPATTLWRFREASIGVQALMWTTIGLLFAGGAQRVMAGQPLWPWRPGRRRVAASAGD